MKHNSIYGIALSIILTAMLTATCHHTSAASLHDEANSVSGEWVGAIERGGTTTAFTFNLKLDGNKITGTVESGHTGRGTISSGKWANNEFSFTASFEKHESIAFTGKLTNGKLVGELDTEGSKSKWEAKKKDASAIKKENTPESKNTTATNSVSGEWDASIEAQGTVAPFAMKLNLNNDKLSGTVESNHFGAGTISEGLCKDNKLSFTIKLDNGMTVMLTGTFQDGKLTGEFSASEMKGKWVAKRK